MIAYNFHQATTRAEFHAALLAEIATLDKQAGRKKSWPIRATAALKKFAAQTSATTKSKKKASIDALWSEIKPVFAALLQHGKCAFCERRLGKDELIAYEQDIEHFRPKKAVVPWPPAEAIGKIPYPADLPPTLGFGEGYRRLPYHELNYIVACKTCNTRCKRNFFPIAGKHQFGETNPMLLAAKERPYLVYPLGSLDDDPETIVTFIGYKAVPAKSKADAYLWNRGRITIAFFLLNDPAREDQLFLERAMRLDLLGHKLTAFEKSKTAERRTTWDAVIREGSALEAHSNCVRSLIRLYASNQSAAWQQIEEARVYRRSMLDLQKWENAKVPSPPS